VPERAHWGCVFSTFHVLLVGVHSLFTCWLWLVNRKKSINGHRLMLKSLSHYSLYSK
jgi:hypothetical protein